MRAKGWTTQEIEQVVAEVSLFLYDGNLTFNRPPEYDTGAHTWVSFTLYVEDSHGPGAHWPRGRRRSRYACWHAHRDVLANLFDRNPEGWVKTAVVEYIGEAGFLSRFPQTGKRNVGSQVQPVMHENCCAGEAEPCRDRHQIQPRLLEVVGDSCVISLTAYTAGESDDERT